MNITKEMLDFIKREVEDCLQEQLKYRDESLPDYNKRLIERQDAYRLGFEIGMVHAFKHTLENHIEK